MSRIWDVDGIDWEDLPTVSDLLCAVDTKILAHEVVLRYGGKAGGCGRGHVESERNLKHARRKIKSCARLILSPATISSYCPNASSIVVMQATALAITTWSRASLRVAA